MNLRSAIEAEPQSDRVIMPEGFCLDEEHRKMLEEKGRKVLRRSKVCKILKELVGLMAEQGIQSKVDPRGSLMDDGTVEEVVRWEPGQFDGVSDNDNVYKGIIIKARTLTGDVFVQGREIELVEKSTWRIDKDAMVRAIAAAYNNPALISWSPVQIG